MTRCRVRIAAAAAVLAATVSCTPKPAPSQPETVDFAAGTCRQAAPAVLGIGRLLGEVRTRARSAREVNAELTMQQSRLRKLLPAADSRARAPLQDLVTAVGFFRIGVDSNTLQSSQVQAATDAQQALVRACTGGS